MIVLSWIQIVLRLGAAALLGGLIGLERERTAGVPRAAGMRTLALVSMGSALFMLVSAYGFTDFTNAAYAKIDPTRIAAQVVSGIGFLGAGAILLRCWVWLCWRHCVQSSGRSSRSAATIQ